jgi:hypothetical protein
MLVEVMARLPRRWYTLIVLARDTLVMGRKAGQRLNYPSLSASTRDNASLWRFVGHPTSSQSIHLL